MVFIAAVSNTNQENTLSAFYNALPNTLTAEAGKVWGVALHSVTLNATPNTWSPPPGGCFMGVYSYSLLNPNIRISFGSWVEKIRFIPSTPQELVDLLEESTKLKPRQGYEERIFHSAFQFQYNAPLKKIVLSYKSDFQRVSTFMRTSIEVLEAIGFLPEQLTAVASKVKVMSEKIDFKFYKPFKIVAFRSPNLRKFDPDYLEVYLRGLSAGPTTSPSCNELLARLCYRRDSQGGSHMVIESPIRRLLNSTDVNRLEFSITGPEGSPLSLKTGQPTVIVLEMEQVSLSETEVNVSVRSSDGDSKYLDNASSDFRVDLNQPLRLQGGYRCALRSLSMSLQLDHLPYEIDFIVSSVRGEDEAPSGRMALTEAQLKERLARLHKIVGGIENFSVISMPQRVPQEDERKVQLHTTHFESEEDLVRVLNIDNDVCVFSIEPNGVGEKKKQASVVFRREGYVLLPWELVALLGYDDNSIVLHVDRRNAPRSKAQIGVSLKLQGTQGQKFVFPEKVNLNALYPRNVFVYAQFVQPSIVGNTQTRLLSVLPLEFQPNEVYEGRHGVVKNRTLRFVPLEFTDLHTLHIQLRDATGRPIRFVKKLNDPVFLVLVFSRV